MIRRNVALLPAYTLVLGLMALFGYLARAVPAVNAGVKAAGGNAQLSVPLLFQHMLPDWFAGIADAAIVIGALVPAAIMSIAAANLFTRNVYKEFLRPAATPAEETRVARLVSLVMKVGALGFALELTKTFSINLQLLGGIWILQIFPVIVISLYTRWFHRFALLIGWAVAMVYGTIQAYRTPGNGQAHFGALDRAGVRAHHLHRGHRAGAEPGAERAVHPGVPGHAAAGRLRRDPARRLPGRPGARLGHPGRRGWPSRAGRDAAARRVPGRPGGPGGPAGPGENNHAPPGAWNWHQLRGGHGKHSTRNGH